MYACISLTPNENLKLRAVVMCNLIVNIKACVKSPFDNLSILL